MRIFLAHASEDKHVGDSINVGLIQKGHDVFFDADDLPPGNNYDDRIEKAINKSDLFVFLISPESVLEGRYTRTELRFARKQWPDPTGRVLPVQVRPTPRETIPPYLTRVTILTREGDLIAETVSEADRMATALRVEADRLEKAKKEEQERAVAEKAEEDRRRKRRRMRVALAVVAVAAVVVIVAAGLWWRQFYFQTNDKPPIVFEPKPQGAINPSGVSPQQRAMADLILARFGLAGFGQLQQIAALARAILDSNLDPNVKAAGTDDSWGLFQLSRKGGLGTGYSQDQLKDPTINISLVINEAKKWPSFVDATTLFDAVRSFVADIDRPADQPAAIAATYKKAQELLGH